MKNFLRFFALVAMIIGIVACDDTTNPTPEPKPLPPIPAEQEPKFGSVAISALDAQSATLGCAIDYSGEAAIEEVGFLYNSGSGEDKLDKCPSVTLAPELKIESLTADTKYLTKCYVVIRGHRYSSAMTSFRTLAEGSDKPDAPTLGAVTVSAVSDSGATFSSTVSSADMGAVSEVGFLYKSASESVPAKVKASVGASFSAQAVGLASATAYEVTAYAVAGAVTYKGQTATFTTQSSQGGGGDVQEGEAKYKGWAELPVEVEKKGDLYYAYHQRADNKSMRNFAVCYSKELGCPVWVAAPMHKCYTGTSGRTNAYGQDPTIQGSGCAQVGKRSGYTRGHMLGSSDRTVSRETNRQVFYYSNIGPQIQDGFNTGGGAWNNLESVVDGKWCADTLYQVIGCHWANKNKKVDGTIIPTHYYKALLRTKKGNTGKAVWNCSASELQCVAFVLEHKPNKGLKPSATHMISVKKLEEMTGFKFFPNVPTAPKDTFNPSDWL